MQASGGNEVWEANLDGVFLKEGPLGMCVVSCVKVSTRLVWTFCGVSAIFAPYVTIHALRNQVSEEKASEARSHAL